MHTHTVNTHPEQWAAILLWHPGNSWGFGALLKGLTSVMGLKVEESAGYSLQNQNGLIIKGVVDWFFSRLDCVYGVQSSMCSCLFF